jgi:hypothetical protein
MIKTPTILNVAGGKQGPLDIPSEQNCFLVNVDKMYYQNVDPGFVEEERKIWQGYEHKTFNINEDAFIFMERTAIWFDKVCVYRYLEHVSFTNILYFIYLLSTVTRNKTLAQMILDEDNFFEENNLAVFPEHDILLTTELLNEPSCPHASIWTKLRAEYFFTLENRFRIVDMCQNFKFDGRDIYLRFIAERL